MKGRSSILAVAALIAGPLLAASAAAGKAAPKEASLKKSEPRSCAACKERRPLVDPASVDAADEAARAAYEAAWEHPETIDGIRCFCGCSENPQTRHLTLLTCFTSAHASGCEICQKEATMAGKMKEEGSSDAEIKGVVESLFKPAS